MWGISARSPGYAGALLLAAAAVFAAPAAAQASAALPGPAMVPCNSDALVTAIQNANSARFATLVLSRGCDYVALAAALAQPWAAVVLSGAVTRPQRRRTWLRSRPASSGAEPR